VDFAGTPNVSVTELAQLYGAGFNVTIAGDLTGVSGKDAYNLALNSKVTSIRLDATSPQTINLSADQYANIATLKAKVAASDLNSATVNVSAVTSSNVLTVAADSVVDSVSLASNQSWSMAYTDYLTGKQNGVLTKISNLVDANLSVTGVTGAQALTAAQDPSIDSISLAAAQVVPALSYNDYLANSAYFAKISNLASATVTVTAVANQAAALAAAADPNI
jgi:hypothetical protein